MGLFGIFYLRVKIEPVYTTHRQGYSQRMRLQRRLYGSCFVHFLAFHDPTPIILWKKIGIWEICRQAFGNFPRYQKPMVWYLTWLFFICLIFWPPEVSKFWRSRPQGSPEVKKHYQNAIETPKTLDLIRHMTYFHWFNIWPFLEVIIEGRSNWRSYICVNNSARLCKG